ncbi:MAG TPA: hypothetical protein GX507_08635 [Clostridia bacterium]|nr:hypothetical protein [Clostridia bacterium]
MAIGVAGAGGFGGTATYKRKKTGTVLMPTFGQTQKGQAAYQAQKEKAMQALDQVLERQRRSVAEATSLGRAPRPPAVEAALKYGTVRPPQVPVKTVQLPTPAKTTPSTAVISPPPGYSEAERQAYRKAGGIRGAIERLEKTAATVKPASTIQQPTPVQTTAPPPGYSEQERLEYAASRGLGGTTGTGGIDFSNLYRQAQEIINQAAQAPDTGALILAQMDQYLSSLTQLEDRIMSQFKEQMGGIDPATQAALTQLRETVAEQRRLLMADLSRRGLLQSGIALEMADRLNKNQLTAEQQLIASRFQSLQDQMNQALINFAQQRLGAMQTYGLAAIQAQERQALARQQAAQQALQYGIGIAGLEQQAQAQQWQRGYAEQQFEWQRQQAEWERQMQERQFEWQKQLASQKQAAVQPVSVRQQFQDSAYTKLLSGYGIEDLSPGERIAIGLSETVTRDVTQDALRFAQNDPRWWGATTAEQRNAVLNEYRGMLTGGMTQAGAAINWSQVGMTAPGAPMSADEAEARRILKQAGMTDQEIEEWIRTHRPRPLGNVRVR